MSSLVGFGLVYLFLFAVWIFVMADKIKAGPDEPA
jgi:cytochrome bd-type quinol oxidase subunit 1